MLSWKNDDYDVFPFLFSPIISRSTFLRFIPTPPSDGTVTRGILVLSPYSLNSLLS